jgi:hypothetical protein
MTLQANYGPIADACNGTTKTFSLPWPFRAQSDVVVQLLDANNNPISPAPVLNGSGTYDYVITGTPDPNTGFYPSGNIVFNNAPPSTDTAWRGRATLDWQDKSYPINGRFPAKSVEAADDRRTLVDQEQDWQLARKMGLSTYDLTGFNPQMPPTTGQAGNVLVVNPAGTGWAFENLGASGIVAGIAGTANQVVVSGPDGAGVVTLSLPSNIRVPITTGATGQGSIGFTRGAVVAGLGLTDTGFTPAGMFAADQMFINSSAAAGGMVIVTQAAAPIKFGINSAEVSRFTSDGRFLMGTTTGLNFVDLAVNANSAQYLKFQNASAGTQATTNLVLVNNNGTTSLQLGYTSTGYTPAGTILADMGYVLGNGAGGMLVGTGIAAPLKFSTNGNEVARFLPTGQLSIGGVNNINNGSANPVDVMTNFNGNMSMKISNLNAGSSAAATFYAQNDVSKNMMLQFNSSAFAGASWMMANQAALWTDGANGLLLATNANVPIRFVINGLTISSFSPLNGGAFLNVDAQMSNGYAVQFKNTFGGTVNNLRMGIATGANSLINFDAQNEIGIWGTNGSTINFSLDSGNTMAFQIRAGGYLFAHGGYAGGATSFNSTSHIFCNTAAQQAITGQNTHTTPYGIAQAFTSDPNNTGSDFLQMLGAYPGTGNNRFNVKSNGGVYNYSANNVNLSDAQAKVEIEEHDDALMGKLWEAYQKVDWCRFKYADQTHDDPNWGYTAQGVRKAFGKIAPELVTTWQEEDGPLTKKNDMLGVYEHDLINIGQAVLAMAQARIEELETRIHTLERTKH